MSDLPKLELKDFFKLTHDIEKDLSYDNTENILARIALEKLKMSVLVHLGLLPKL